MDVFGLHDLPLATPAPASASLRLRFRAVTCPSMHKHLPTFTALELLSLVPLRNSRRNLWFRSLKQGDGVQTWLPAEGRPYTNMYQ